VPVVTRPPPLSLNASREREEVASLVPAKSGSRTNLAAVDGRSLANRTAVVKDAALPLDEDQFDIPTFLRRQGQTEMP